MLVLLDSPGLLRKKQAASLCFFISRESIKSGIAVNMACGMGIPGDVTAVADASTYKPSDYRVGGTHGQLRYCSSLDMLAEARVPHCFVQCWRVRTRHLRIFRECCSEEDRHSEVSNQANTMQHVQYMRVIFTTYKAHEEHGAASTCSPSTKPNTTACREPKRTQDDPRPGPAWLSEVAER